MPQIQIRPARNVIPSQSFSFDTKCRRIGARESL